MSGHNPIHSTGRGGAGNIGEDPNTYVDGDIVREGIAGQSGRADGGEYSAGRGGAGNIVHPAGAGVPAGGVGVGGAARTNPVSSEVVPETATRAGEGYENYHTGRGGQGNIHRDEFGGHSAPQKHGVESLLDKAKHAIGLDRKKEGE